MFDDDNTRIEAAGVSDIELASRTASALRAMAAEDPDVRYVPARGAARALGIGVPTVASATGDSAELRFGPCCGALIDRGHGTLSPELESGRADGAEPGEASRA